VLLAIAIMILVTVVAAFWLAPHMAEGRVLFDQAPDRPRAFGYKMAWLAIRTENTQSVVDLLGLEGAVPCNWNSGIGSVYDDRLGDDHVFVSPPVSGWTFVVGISLPHPTGRGFADKCTPFLLSLGRCFPEVQYFFSFPPIDFFSWVRVVDAKLVRGFAIGDEGVVWNKGRTTAEERALGLKLFELRGVKERKGDAGGALILHPTEEHVMRLAHAWSIDPIRIEGLGLSAARGFIAVVPQSWRPERLRKAA